MMTTQRKAGRVPWALWSSERGGVAMYLGFAMMFIMPLMAGAISVSQTYSLNTELQQAADAAALAGAIELDNTEAGCAAAIAAVQDAVQNFQSFANDGGGAEAKIGSIMLLEALPPAPLTEFERLGVTGRYAEYEATKCADVRYLRVVTELREQMSYPMRAYLLMTLFKLTPDAESDAAARMVTASAAVAGRVTVACKTMPLMMCNPIEIGPPGCGDPALLDGAQPNPPGDLSMATFLKNNPQWHRRLFRIKWVGPNAGIAPGVFGLLEPVFSDKKAVPGITEEFAMIDPPLCVALDSPLVEVKEGQAQAVVNGLNVRFDIYGGSVGQNKDKSDPRLRPGPNVTKGLLPGSAGGQGNKCTPKAVCDDPTKVDTFGKCSKLRRDKCFDDETLPGCHITAEDTDNPQFDARVGDGKWDITEYFEINHPQLYGELFGDPSACNGQPLCGGNGWGDLQDLLDDIRDSVPEDKYDDDLPVTTDNPPSRYAIYNWELDNGMIPGVDTNVGLTPWEEGKRPSAIEKQCSTAGIDTRDRRNIYIAIVNCCEQMEALSKGERKVRVDEILEAFMTEPAASNAAGGNPDIGAIYIEAVKVLGATGVDDVVLRDYVQLY